MDITIWCCTWAAHTILLSKMKTNDAKELSGKTREFYIEMAEEWDKAVLLPN